MINLILAVVTSAMISCFLRIGEKKVTDVFALFLSNYLVCSLLSFLFIVSEGSQGALRVQEGSGFALGLGIIGGILFLLSFVLLRFNISKNGVVLASTFMRLGVLVPTLMAILIFREAPKALQIAGMVLALIAIVIISWGKDDQKSSSGGKWWLIVLLLSGGFTDSLANIYDKVGKAAVKDQYLLIVFLVAALLCVGILIFHRHMPSGKEWLWGVIVGVPNYFSARFMLLSLGELPAIVVYPVYNIATILLISAIGIIAFRERLDAKKTVGLAIIIGALVILNL